MDHSNIENNQETTPVIHTIPDEFYGGVKRSAAPAAAGQVTVSSYPAGPTVPARAGILPKTAFFKSPKFILIAGIGLFVVLVGVAAFYYIRQAQITRQKLLKPASVPTAIAPSPPPAAPETVPTEAPTSTPEEAAAPTITPPAAPFSVIFPFKNYTKNIDTDNDGLTDEEEKIFGTEIEKPDSDSDGYVDSLEVANLYNPLGFKPVRLLDSGKVKVYLNPTFNYSIFYPESWISQALDANNKDVMFTSATGEFIEVLAEDNPLKMSVEAWYLSQSPGVEASQLEHFTTKEKFEGVKSPDGLVAYLPSGDKIFVINYNIGLKTEVNFLNTFEMMINSFRAQGSLEDLPFGGQAATGTATITE